MIVYAGKQFGNNFNNGDEALFQDANRPRDNDMFKIKPGMQAEKWDWKKTNKNRQPSSFHAYGYSLVMGYDPYTYRAYDGVNGVRIRFKSSYTESDFSSVTPYARANGTSLSASDLLTYVNNAYGENGDAKATVKDERLEIEETGVYLIDFFAQFIYPSGYSYSSYTDYPLYLALLVDGSNYAYTQGRSCFYLDRLHDTACFTISKGSKLSLGVGHGFNGYNILTACGITAVRLG